MTTASKWRTWLQVVLASGLLGVTFGFGGCASAMYQNFNPCGTILNCDNAEFDLLHMDASQPNYEYNPTCVLPALVNCNIGSPVNAGWTVNGPSTGVNIGAGTGGTAGTTGTTGTTGTLGTTGTTGTTLGTGTTTGLGT